MFRYFYNLNRLFFYPLLVWVLPRFSRKVRSRVAFEHEKSQAFKSFKEDGIIANFAFEVSSEGELEQIRPLIDSALSAGKRVELIYCSDSVDHKCQKLYADFPEQLRLLRLPLLRYNPFSRQSPQRWLTAPKFFLCRYDFFPELIFYGQRSDVEFILLWGTLKNFPRKWPMNSYQKYVYQSFDKIVAATKLDQDQFKKLLGISSARLNEYDFRPWQIVKRLESTTATVASKLPASNDFVTFLDHYPPAKRIIFGSFWDNEVDVFKSKDFASLIAQKHLVVVVCHKLEKEYLKMIKYNIEKDSQLPVYTINEDSSELEVQGELQALLDQPGVLMLNIKGVLCELYSFFGQAFVGGGHGVSVHSLLEPFLAGAVVYCGPKVHRSTEFDLIRERSPDRLHIVKQLPQFFSLISSFQTLEYTEIQGLKDYYQNQYPKLIDWLGIE